MYIYVKKLGKRSDGLGPRDECHNFCMPMRVGAGIGLCVGAGVGAGDSVPLQLVLQLRDAACEQLDDRLLACDTHVRLVQQLRRHLQQRQSHRSCRTCRCCRSFCNHRSRRRTCCCSCLEHRRRRLCPANDPRLWSRWRGRKRRPAAITVHGLTVHGADGQWTMMTCKPQLSLPMLLCPTWLQARARPNKYICIKKENGSWHKFAATPQPPIGTNHLPVKCGADPKNPGWGAIHISVKNYTWANSEQLSAMCI